MEISWPTPPMPAVMWTRRAQYIDNHDGDTVTMLIDQGFGNFLGLPNTLRLIGTNAPELATGIPGDASKEFVRLWFLPQPKDDKWPYVVETYRPDKYGARWDVRIWRVRDRACLNVDLLNNGYAVVMK